MSGGHWGYRQHDIEAQGQALAGLFALLGEVEHTLDWGICCDTCLNCAYRKVGMAMESYFDGSPETGVSMLRDHDRLDTQCDGCLKRILAGSIYPKPAAHRQKEALRLLQGRSS